MQCTNKQHLLNQVKQLAIFALQTQNNTFDYVLLVMCTVYSNNDNYY